jgi:hypothetical protein
MFDFFKKPNIMQGVLTLVLIGLLAFLAFSFFSNKDSDPSQLQQVTRTITFEEAATKYLNGSYEVYTRGSLLIKKQNITNFAPNGAPLSTVTPSSVEVVQNQYNDIFFYLDKGNLRRINYTSFGQNFSLIVNEQDQIVTLDNKSKTYFNYSEPKDDKEKLVYFGQKEVLKNLLPLVPLLEDYRNGKFIPAQRANNLYSGKWQHPLFTNGEIVDITIQLDFVTGLFRVMTIPQPYTTNPSEIFFDFREQTNINDLMKIPADYTPFAPVTPKS